MKKFFLVMFLALVIFIYSAELFVPSQQYSTIQSAIGAANDGDIVSVYPGIYNEYLNIFHSITLRKVEGVSGECTILSTHNAGHFDALITIYSINSLNVSISGFILDGNSEYGCIIDFDNRNSNSSLSLTNNKFQNYTYEGVNLHSEGFIELNNNNFIGNNNVSERALRAIVVGYNSQWDSPEVSIINNNFTNHTCGEIVSRYTDEISIKNNVFTITENSSSNAKAIDIYASNNDKAIIHNNLIINENSDYSPVAIFVYNNANVAFIDISNNTIINESDSNHYSALTLSPYSAVDIFKNNILLGCSNIIKFYTPLTPNLFEVNYCCFDGDIPSVLQPAPENDNNINVDPQLTTNYHLSSNSPCIDTGDPNSDPDIDGSRADMGCFAYDHDFDTKHFEEGIYWLSFPRLTNQNILPGAYYEQLYYENGAQGLIQETSNGQPLIDGFEIIRNYSNSIQYTETDGFQEHNLDNKLYRYEGYKITVGVDASYTDLIVDGDRITAYTSDLAPLDNNWLGYYLTYPQNIEDAFGDFWGDVNKVWAQDWYYDRLNSSRGTSGKVPANSTTGKVLEYGKMYIVQMSNSVTNFSWNGSEIVNIPIKKAEPQSFTFEEKTDYEAIDLLNIPDGVEEVGIYEDGICLGAVAVQDSNEQVLVYSDAANRNAGNFTFEFYSGGRSSEKVKHYEVLNFRTGTYEAEPLQAGRNEYSVVRFNTEDTNNQSEDAPQKVEVYGNYPNPFNPTTTISFNLPSNQDISLEIYNIKGQKVSTIYSGDLAKGIHSMVWNGTDSNNKSVSSGVYFYKLRTADETYNRKMLLVK